MAFSVGYAHWHYNTDIPNSNGVGGWCWAEGELSEFSNALDLSKNVLWLTNLPWEFHIAIGAAQHKHIKRNDFLPVPLEKLAQELSISPLSQELYANALSVIGARIIALGQRCYGAGLLQQCLEQNTLSQAIAHLMGWIPPQDARMIDEELHRDIIWRNLTPHALLRYDVPKADCAILRAPWFLHAKTVLSCPLPSVHEPWIEIDVPQTERLRYLQTTDVPAVVEIHDAAITSTWSSIYDFSASANRWSRKRRWMCSPEVLFLGELGSLEIGRIFIQPTGYVCDAMAWSLPNAGDALALSISAGLLAHAHWLSGSVPLTHRFWPIRAMWLHSADRLRLACMLPALQGISGLKLVGYGEGSISVHGSSESIGEVIRRAPHAGISPTPSTWAMTEERAMIQQAGWIPPGLSVYETTVLSLSNRPIGDLLRLDSASIHSLTDENAAIREIAGILKELKNV